MINNSKLIDLYRTLDTIEKRRFAEYVESPFFNSNKQVVLLNSYIANLLEKDEQSPIYKKKIYIRLFGKQKYVEQKVSDTMTFLMRLLESYISQIRFEKIKLVQKEFLLTELRERNLDKHFISNSNDYRKLLEKKNQDASFYHERYILERELDHYFIKKEVRKSNESLQAKSDNLDIYYLSEKLKDLCEMENRKNIIGAEYNPKMKSEVLEHIKHNQKLYKSIPIVHIYYTILLCLTEPKKSDHFLELKSELKKHADHFSREEARQMYDHAQNYCIKRINSGESDFLEQLFSIYESLLENRVIFEGAYLSQWDYKNIVSVAMRLNKFDWTKQFIENFKKHIAPDSRENAYEYNLASYYYSKKDYRDALKLLQKVEFTDVFYHLGAKSMLLKMYYELEEVEPFYSLVDAFKVYLLRNKKISVYQRTVHQNLVKYTKNAFDLKLKGPVPSRTIYEKAIQKLKDKINKEKNITNLQWLQEQVNELTIDD